MTRAPSSALRWKYTHHSPTLPTKAARNATIASPVTDGSADNEAPITTIDSPSAIRMNDWQRSAK